MSNTNLITCPNCNHQFSLSDLEKHELEEMREKLQRELKADADKRALEWAKSEIEKAKKEEQDKSQKQSIELENLRKRDEESRKKEMDFLRQSQEFEQVKKNQAFEIEKAKIEERKKLESELGKYGRDAEATRDDTAGCGRCES